MARDISSLSAAREMGAVFQGQERCAENVAAHVEKKAVDSGAAASSELLSPLAHDVDVHVGVCRAKNPADDQGLSLVSKHSASRSARESEKNDSGPMARHHGDAAVPSDEGGAERFG